MSSSNGRLVAASKAGSIEEVCKLLSLVDININYAEWNGDTALSIASKFGHKQVVQLLVDKEVDTNCKDKKGETALMHACNKGYLDISHILLDRGANLNIQSKLGYTALMGASINGRVDLVDLLVSNGADVTLKTTEGKMAIDFAKTDEIRSILLSAVDSSISTKGQIPTPSGAEVVSAGDTGHTAERTAHQLASPAKQPPPPPHARAPEAEPSSRVLIPPPPPSSPPPSSPPPPPPPPPLAISVPDVDVAEPCDTAPMCGETNDHNNNQRPDTRTKAEGEENVGSGEGSEGEGSVQEAPSFAKRLTTARLLHQLIAHCEGHHDHNLHHHSKPPFRAFRDRIAHLKHIYCGEGGLLEVASQHNQECVPEYFALRMEKHLQEALPLVDPNAKRGYITNTLGGLGDRKTLLKLTETDRNVTQCLRELVEALHALQIAELSAALDVQHRLGPELVYELLHVREDLHVKKTNLCGDHVDASSQNETEDPHTPLLHPGVRSPLGHLTALLTGSSVAHSRDGQKEKDGRIQSLNLTRATVAPKARRAPTRRRFEATEDSSLQDLLEMLPSMADFTSRLSSSVPDNWKHFFGVEGGDGGSGVDTGAGNAPTVKVDKVPDEWFEFPSDSLDVAKARTSSSCAADEEAEARKWDRLENLAEGTAAAGAISGIRRPAPPRSPAPSRSQDSQFSPLMSGEQTSTGTGRSPKRISNTLLAKLGGFDPTKVKPPGRSPAFRGATYPSSPYSTSEDCTGDALPVAPFAAHSPQAQHDCAGDHSTSSPSLPHLKRATNQKTRRAPARRRFELKDGEMPTLIVPLPEHPDTAVQAATGTPKTPSTFGSALKSIFKRSTILGAASSPAPTTDVDGSSSATATATATGSSGKPEPVSSLQLPAVLLDSPHHQSSQQGAASGTHTPKTPSAGIAGMLGNLGSLLGGKSSRKNQQQQQQSGVVTQSPTPSASQSSFADNVQCVEGVKEFLREQSIDGGDILNGGKIIVQNMAHVAEKLPIIGAAAVLLLQLIDLCDAYRCNKSLFKALKSRMQHMYKLYFAEGGVADIAHRKGKDSVVEPFARHLEVILLDAIDYLTAFTEKGFFRKLLSGRRPQQRFAEIDSDITKCLEGLTVALQLLQIADLSAALEGLQVQKKAQEDVYEVVTDIQRRVDVHGGLHGVKSMGHAQLQQLCEELGMRDATELREEVTECQERIEVAVDKVSENVREIKTAVAVGNQQFVELKELISELQQQPVHHHRGTHKDQHHETSHVDLSMWKLRESPQIDRKVLLGSGSFGSVYAGSYLGRQAAFKLPNRNAGVLQVHHNPALYKEVRLHLRVCACPGVVQILAVALQANELTSEPCVIMERAIGSLYDYLHRYKRSAKFLPAINFSLTSKLTLTLQVASAMEYISAAGLIHRDIKASNVLLFFHGSNSAGGDPDVCAKICDFGMSKSTSAESSFEMSSHISVKGTPSYLAPEAFDVQYSSASDVYAYGILLNETLTEHLPVPASVAGHMAPTIFQLRDAVCREGERPTLFDESGSIGDSLRDLITHCWAQNPDQRCSFAQITVELTHILHAALTVAKYGSRRMEDPFAAAEEGASTKNLPTFSPLSSPAPARPVISHPNTNTTTTSSTVDTTSSTVDITDNAVDTAATVTAGSAVSHPSTDESVNKGSLATTTVTTTATATPSASAETAASTIATASENAADTLRSLEDLSVAEVGTLMDFIHLHPLKEVLISHRVSGLMLSYCEGVEDLLSKEYGLASRGLAGGLMKKIQDWKVNGVPHC